jgi:hypothetical protein
MDPTRALDEYSQPILSATGDPLCEQPTVTPANPEDVERVKGKWGEDLNTAFQYEKYVGDRVEVGGWASSALRYEWQDEFETDGIGPQDENLEKQLFGDDGEGNMGINFDKYVPSDNLGVQASYFCNPLLLFLSCCIG